MPNVQESFSAVKDYSLQFFLSVPPQIKIKVTTNGGSMRKYSCADYPFLNASHMYLSAVCSIAFLKYPYCLPSVAKWLKKWLCMIWGEFIVSWKSIWSLNCHYLQYWIEQNKIVNGCKPFQSWGMLAFFRQALCVPQSDFQVMGVLFLY